MAKKRFLRTKWRNYSKLGRGRKKKQKYRKAKGCDNKQRLRMKSNQRNVSIGFGNNKNNRNFIRGLNPIIIKNLKELKNVKEKNAIILAKIGDKKRKEIADYAIKNKIEIVNLNPEEFLKKLERKQEDVKKIRDEKKERKSKEKKKGKKKEDKKEIQTNNSAEKVENEPKK